MTRRLVLVDDHALFRAGVRTSSADASRSSARPRTSTRPSRDPRASPRSSCSTCTCRAAAASGDRRSRATDPSARFLALSVSDAPTTSSP